MADAVDLDPASRVAAEERLALLYDLRRKYGDSLEAVVAFGAAAAAELDALENQEGERERLRAEESERRAALEGGGDGPVGRPPRGRRAAGRGRQRGAAAARAAGRRLRDRAGGGRDRPDGRGSRDVHLRPEPRRAAAPARSHRVGWRGEPPVARPQGRARGGRRDAAPRLRRGRRRASAGATRPPSGSGCGRSVAITRSCASPICRRSPRTPMPTS